MKILNFMAIKKLTLTDQEALPEIQEQYSMCQYWNLKPSKKEIMTYQRIHFLCLIFISYFSQFSFLQIGGQKDGGFNLLKKWTLLHYNKSKYLH